jgi:tetratricopeptide (TPR) repeat protein
MNLFSWSAEMRTGPFRAILAVLCAVVFSGCIRCYSQNEALPSAVQPSASTPGVSGSDRVKPLETRPATPSYADDPKFQKALVSAKETRMPVEERLARWKNANKIAKGQCIECLHQMIQWQIVQKQWKDVYNTCNQLDAIATTPKEKSYAEAERGSALMHGNDDEPRPDQVKEAEASMRSALAIAPRSANLIFLEGRALAMMGRDDDAKEMFQKYLDLEPVINFIPVESKV